jgi:probable rRNA maturation factor
MKTSDITIAVHDPRWHSKITGLAEHTEAVIEKVFSCHPHIIEKYPDNVEYQVAILFTDGKEIRELNQRFRGKDKATNVLSFPAVPDALIPDDQPHIVGDIIIAYDVIAEEAEAQEKDFYSHATHMIIHGMLHLLGYDHMYDEEAELMEQQERALLAEFHISDPYKMSDH